MVRVISSSKASGVVADSAMVVVVVVVVEVVVDDLTSSGLLGRKSFLNFLGRYFTRVLLVGVTSSKLSVAVSSDFCPNLTFKE